MMTLPIRRQSAPVLRGLSIFFYGMAKVGKTTQAAKFPEPLILNCEPGGTNFLSGEYDVIDVASLDQLDGLAEALVKAQHKTLLIDGITWLINDTVRQRAKGKEGNPRRRIYAEVTDQVGRILGVLMDSDKIVIATGHSRMVDIDDDPQATGTAKPGDPDMKEIRPDINPSLAAGVLGLFSIICYCFADAAGSKIVTKPIRTSKLRILAGDRSGILDRIMPLDADLVMAKLRAHAKGAA